LLGASAVGFVDRFGHRVGHLVSVEDDLAINVAGRAPKVLD